MPKIGVPTVYWRESGISSGELAQGGEDGVDGLLWGEVGGVDGELREAGVERAAPGEAKFSGGGVLEDGAGDVLEHAAVEEGGKWGVEEDGEGPGRLLKKKAVGEFFGSASAEGEDGVGGRKSGGEGDRFEATEMRFAVALEELRDGGSGAALKVGIEIEEGKAGACGEETADR